MVSQANNIPNIPWLPPSPQDVSEWPAWEQMVLEHRVNVLQETADSVEARAREISRCDLSSEYMLNTYGMIYEARPDNTDYDDFTSTLDEELSAFDELPASEELRAGVIPFIMYPYQIEVAAWWKERMRSRGPAGDGVNIKARDMGLSNQAAFMISHDWGFRYPYQARMLSRNEKLVDETGNPDALFWKVDTFLQSLPPWLFAAMAPGFDWKVHRLMGRLINPANGNLISGESTQANAGRGGRATVILYDEAAFMEQFGAIWSAGRASTNHRIAISTVSTKAGMDFYNLVHGEEGYERPPVLAITWDQHPLHDNDWYNAEQARDHPDKFAQEVLMDWTAGTGEWVYPESHPYEPTNAPYIPLGGPSIITIDDGWGDEYSLVLMQWVEKEGRLRVLDSYQNSHKVVDFYGYLLTGQKTSQFMFGRRELEFMHSLRNKGPFMYYGDAHGASIEQVSGESVFSRLANKFGINVNYYIGPDSGTRLTFSQRRLQLGKLLPLMDFDDTPGSRFVLESLKKHRFKDPGDQELMRVYKEPIHSTKWSHTVSALEYFAVQFDMFKMTTALGRGGIHYTGRRLQDGKLRNRQNYVNS